MSEQSDKMNAIRAKYATFREFAEGELHVLAQGEVVTNPFTEVECRLEPLAVAGYDYVKGLESLLSVDAGLEPLFVEALHWFGETYPDEYFTLLD